MKKLLALCMAACAAAALWGAPVFSGVFDSRLTTGAGAGEAPVFFYGMEEYLNLRLRAKVGESVTVDGAFNIIAGAGTSAQPPVSAGRLLLRKTSPSPSSWSGSISVSIATRWTWTWGLCAWLSGAARCSGRQIF
jgi:hypothetical protein